MFVFGEFKARTERRGEGAREGDGVGDQVNCGVGGCDVTECVHVLEHTVHVVEEHLRNIRKRSRHDGKIFIKMVSYTAH